MNTLAKALTHEQTQGGEREEAELYIDLHICQRHLGHEILTGVEKVASLELAERNAQPVKCNSAG